MNELNPVKAAPVRQPEMNQKYGFPANGKLFYKVTLKLASPLILGCGEDERSDVDVMRDPVEGHPLIPATSLIGVFSSYLEDCLEIELRKDEILKKNYHYLFGFRECLRTPDHKNNEPPQFQSALQIQDVLLKKPGNSQQNEVIQPVLRDGVKIDPVTGAAEDKSKYNYEVVEGNHKFCIHLEITLRENFDKAIFQKLLNTLFRGIENDNIRLGAKTNKGFGKVELMKVELAELDFSRKRDVFQWLSGENYPYSTLTDLESKPQFTVKNEKFTIDAWFKIKNSFLIKEYADESGDVDARHIQQNGEYVLPGTSVMGAIQHQARKILYTILPNSEMVSEKMDELFGFVKTDKPETEQNAGKGHVLIEETIIDRGKLAEEIQTRIKVDRFTGGVVSGALFQMKPLWQKGNHQVIQVKMIFDGKGNLKWAPGLLLLLLKDLWDGDLPIGGEKNIGRGSLEGVSAEIKEGDTLIAELKSDKNGGIAEAEKHTNLEKYVTKLWEGLGNGQEKDK